MNHDCGGETSCRAKQIPELKVMFPMCVLSTLYSVQCVAKTYTTIAGQSIQSVPYLNRDLTYTNWDKNTYFAWFIGHKERQETADFTSD